MNKILYLLPLLFLTVSAEIVTIFDTTTGYSCDIMKNNELDGRYHVQKLFNTLPEPTLYIPEPDIYDCGTGFSYTLAICPEE